MKNQNTTLPENEVSFVNGHEMDAKLKENDFVILVSDMTNGSTYHWIWDKTKISADKINGQEYAKQIADALRLLGKDDISHDVELQLSKVLGGAIVLPYAMNTKGWEMSQHKVIGHNSLYILVDYDNKDYAVRTVGTAHNESVKQAVNEGLNKMFSSAFASGFIKRTSRNMGFTMLGIVTPGTRVGYTSPKAGAPGSNQTSKKKKRK